jgi:predicted transcriptional regulator of viral defense system
MNQIDALSQLRAVGMPVLESRDAAAILNVSASNATTILRRLAAHALVTHLSRSRWLITDRSDPYALPEWLSAPWPAYVSLQSALFRHGLIEQIPTVIYAVTPGRARQVTTPLGTVSYHRLPPTLFSGFTLEGVSGAKVATAEKALFDVVYLSPARSGRFAALPELTVPSTFAWDEVTGYLQQVGSASRRTHIRARLDELRSCARIE